MKDNLNEPREDILEGRNPVFEALKSGRQIDKILKVIVSDAGDLAKPVEFCCAHTDA